jgi:hypothetical protein
LQHPLQTLWQQLACRRRLNILLCLLLPTGGLCDREKMPAGLENKKGAGSYELDMTTLYVHYGGAGHYAVPQLRHLLLEVRIASVVFEGCQQLPRLLTAH